MDALDTFRTNMKRIRTEQGITLKEIADELGVKEPTVQRYESGKGIKSIPYKNIIKIAEILNCSPNRLTGWEENEKSPQVELDIKQGELMGQLLFKFEKLSEGNKKIVMNLIDSLLENQN